MDGGFFFAANGPLDMRSQIELHGFPGQKRLAEITKPSSCRHPHEARPISNGAVRKSLQTISQFEKNSEVMA